MSAADWQRVESIYHAALACPLPERAAFLTDACGNNEGDDAVRREVDSLLAAGDGADSLLKTAGAWPRPPLMGQRLGVYELTSLLGAGGMGEVYRARDPRLGRDVAIKILPPEVADDPDRLRRFEQEARAAAALNHPNILSVHDVGTDNGVAYLVTELLEGRTLREAMSPEAGLKPTPYMRLEKALDFAGQIADGLAAAHARGIVHRDLKPENLFVTTDGRVKILDFGLAKVFEAGLKPTPYARETATASGVILGTVGYMAPEQIRGQAVDARTDIFAFGCVLYEMLAGRRAFAGATSMDTLSAILTHAPAPLAEARAGDALPAALRRIVERCLDKTPAARFQTATDLAFALREVIAGSGASVSSAPASVVARFRTGERTAWLAAACFAVTTVATLAWVGWMYGQPTAPAESVQFDVPPPQSGSLTDTNQNWPYWDRQVIALSPDGRRLAFMAAGGGQRGVWVRDLDSSTPRFLPGTTGAWSLEWSPDGQSVAFVTPRGGQGGALKSVNLTGAAPTVLAEGVNLSPISWGEAGVILFSRDGRAVSCG